MKLSAIRIENLRSFKDETIQLGDYCCLVGPNGAGKSTILMALRLFFRDKSDVAVLKLEGEDFHKRNTKDPVRVTLTFTDIEDEAKADLAHYVRQDQLVVTAEATWNQGTRSADIVQYGHRLGVADFAPFFEAESKGAKVDALGNIFEGLHAKHPKLGKAKTKPAMLEAMQVYETENPQLLSLIKSNAEFYGVSQGKDRLAKYLQWVYVPAVKDASTEQLEGRKTALNQLLERTVRSKVSFDAKLSAIREAATVEYQKLLDDNDAVLSALSGALNERIQEWAHPDASLEVKWFSDPNSSVSLAPPLAEIVAGEGLFKGKVSRFGHGLQRSFLIALLQELADVNSTTDTTLILGCEEPELYQHPPQARHLVSVFERLARDGKAQVIVTTHNPLFVSGRGFPDLRVVRRLPSHETKVKQFTLQGLSQLTAEATGERPISPEGECLKVNQVLCSSVNEMFFCGLGVLVEGQEDAACLLSYLALSEKMLEFRKLGCHIVPMPTSGKTFLLHSVAVAKGFEIPCYVLFDCDTDKLEKLEKHKNTHEHEKENLGIQRLCNVQEPIAFPNEHLWFPNLTAWSSDIGSVCASDYGADEEWFALRDRVRVKYGISDVENLNKNSIFIGYVLAEAWKEGKRFPTLGKAVDAILACAAGIKESLKPKLLHYDTRRAKTAARDERFEPCRTRDDASRSRLALRLGMCSIIDSQDLD